MCIYKNGKISSMIFDQLHRKNKKEAVEEKEEDPADQFFDETGGY
jgi:hypothetical protein